MSIEQKKVLQRNFWYRVIYETQILGQECANNFAKYQLDKFEKRKLVILMVSEDPRLWFIIGECSDLLTFHNLIYLLTDADVFY